MKKRFLHTLFVLSISSAVSVAQTLHFVKTTGNLTYDPSDLTITVGDTVSFQASGFHPLREVTEATWNANENTAKANGFSCTSSCKIPFPEAGVFYYVCVNHVGSVMKGKLTVEAPSGILSITSKTSGFQLYPNPTQSLFTMQFANPTLVQSVEVFDAQGNRVAAEAVNASLAQHTMNLAHLQGGLYQVVITTAEKKMVEKLMVK